MDANNNNELVVDAQLAAQLEAAQLAAQEEAAQLAAQQEAIQLAAQQQAAHAEGQALPQAQPAAAVAAVAVPMAATMIQFDEFDVNDLEDIAMRWTKWLFKIEKYMHRQRITTNEDKVVELFMHGGYDLQQLYNC